MDPYLEHPSLWTSVHSRLIHAVANQLQPLLVPRYIATVEDRVYFEESPQQRQPDLWVQRLTAASARTALAAPALACPVIVETAPLEVHERYVAILDRYQDQRVVTVLEILSPSNKTTGERRDAYLDKQREILASQTHLVEIDLLRRGQHTVAVPANLIEQRGNNRYLICVSRWPQRRRHELYPVSLPERLPCFGIPLTEPDPDVPLDLQAALLQAYWDGRYMLRVRYDAPCDPPLSAEDQAWATQQWHAYKTAYPELFPPEGTP
jgi:hypothetical protein